ncbi:MAG TPA: class I SAM-dependent rRNA methyltransferase [Blastocatellia bacterium]|nr:class I SAM-dependent rRNA methyltransferase [Blastocatellia bacterium]
MNQSQVTPETIIAPKGVDRIRAGHLWVFRSDVVQAPHVADSGAITRVVDKRNRFVAWAQFGAESEITLRVISKTDYAETKTTPQFWREFWRDRLLAAYEWRKRVVDKAEAYRLVHAEGDWLSGLIIDRYGDAFSLQTLSRGMDVLKEMWVELLKELFDPRLIVERNDVKVRQLEGLPMTSDVLYRKPGADAATEFQITENGLKYWVDLIGGQKTGAFLDQRENRAAAWRYARGRGLDCFSFHGSFALHLAKGCDHVTALDISAPALERAARNADLNQMRNVEFVEANVFDKLADYDARVERFDTIVLDPPAFAKNRGAIKAALRGYKEINLRALRLLNPGGILITCSCSYHVDEALFLEMLKDAAHDAGRMIQMVEKRTQSRDHPILLTVPETYYLKCVILRIL